MFSVMKVKEITICGGGSLAHAIAGVISANSGIKVNILTRCPEKWNKQIRVQYYPNMYYKGLLI